MLLVSRTGVMIRVVNGFRWHRECVRELGDELDFQWQPKACNSNVGPQSAYPFVVELAR